MLRRSSGFGSVVDPGIDRPLWERDTVACGHCGKAIWVKPGTAATIYLIPTRDAKHWLEEPGAACRLCMTPVCLPCHDRGVCAPFERQLELAERGAIILGAG